MTVVWINKSNWRKPGPIVAIGLLNAWSFARLGHTTHLFVGNSAADHPSPEQTRDDIAGFYGLEPCPALHVHRVAKGGRVREWFRRRTYAEGLRTVNTLLATGEQVLLVTRELGLVPTLARLQRKHRDRLVTLHEAHDFHADLSHLARPTFDDHRMRWCERTWLRRLSGLLCITSEQQKLYQQHLPGITSIALPLGTLDLPVVPADQRFERRTLGYVGHLHAAKGVELLLRLAPKLKAHGIRLRLYGGTREQVGRLEARLRENGALETTHLSPFTSPANLHRELASSVSALMTTLTDTFYNRYLTCPVKALDALSHNLPSIASDLPSTREVLHDAALFVPPDNEQAVLEAALRLFQDPALYGRLAEAARTRARQLLWQRRAEAILQWVHHLPRR